MTKLKVPEPTENETEKEFITRCMSNYGMRIIMKVNNQRAAVCYKSWNDNNLEEK